MPERAQPRASKAHPLQLRLGIWVERNPTIDPMHRLVSLKLPDPRIAHGNWHAQQPLAIAKRVEPAQGAGNFGLLSRDGADYRRIGDSRAQRMCQTLRER
jgi:hypothetical protein